MTRREGAWLDLAVDADGACRVVAPPDQAMPDLRRQSRLGRLSFELEATAWVDAWAERHELIERLQLDASLSLWWFLRPHIIEQLRPLAANVETVIELIERVAPGGVRLHGADAVWSHAVRAASETTGVALDLTTPQGHDRRRPLDRLGAAAARVRRVTAGLRRGFAEPRSGDVAAIVYALTKRVNTLDGPRYMDPTFEPVLDELDRRGRRVRRWGAPLAGDWRQDLAWLRCGHPGTVPLEAAYAIWRLRRGHRLPRVGDWLAAAWAATAAPVRWRAVDVSRWMRALVNGFWASRLRRAVRALAFFEHVLRERRVRVLAVNHEYSTVAMAAVAAARRVGARSVALQHGVIWRGHPGYNLPATRTHTMPRPDRICVFGAFEHDLLRSLPAWSSTEIHVTGLPRLDLVKGVPPALTRSQLTSRLALPAEAPLVLFTSTGQSRMLAERLGRALSASPRPVGVVVKLHPLAEEDPAAYARVARSAGVTTMRVLREEFDLYDLLRLVDVHMSLDSTVLSEAAAFGLPNVLIASDRAAPTVDYVGRGVAVRVEDYPSLAEAIADVLSGATADRLAAARRSFVAAHFHAIDGRAASRAADAIEAALDG